MKHTNDSTMERFITDTTGGQHDMLRLVYIAISVLMHLLVWNEVMLTLHCTLLPLKRMD